MGRTVTILYSILGYFRRLPEADAVHGPKVSPLNPACPASVFSSPHISVERGVNDVMDAFCRLNHMAAGMNLNQAMKADASNKEIEEAMKRVREAQSLISAAIEPGSEYWPPTSLLLASSVFARWFAAPFVDVPNTKAVVSVHAHR